MKRLIVGMALLTAIAASADTAPRETAGESGEGISTGRYITGGIIGSAIGYGIGHAIQGRYMPLGLVFSLTEAAATVVIIADAHKTADTNIFIFGDTKYALGTAGVIGLVALLGVHVWEVVDVWVAGAELRRKAPKADLASMKTKIVALPIAPGGDAPGLSMVMRF